MHSNLLPLFLPVVLLLSGCDATNMQQFADGHPSMALENWMVGTVDGYGIIIDRFGTIKSQFRAHEIGSWDASTKTLTLVEQITYLQNDDTPPTHRTWRFVESAPGHWLGTAPDVIGTATGIQQGNAWHLVFHQTLPIGGRQIEVTVDDLRLRESDNVAVDHSAISKFGINLATSNIAFIKSQ